MDLLEAAAQLGLEPKRVSVSRGGEYHSGCPKCGGKDRFVIWPKHRLGKAPGAFWCRQCRIRGDSIGFFREFFSLSYLQACARLGLSPGRSDVPSRLQSHSNVSWSPVLASDPPLAWQVRLGSLVNAAGFEIDNHRVAEEQLKARGFTPSLVRQYGIGYQAQGSFLERKDLGLKGSGRVWIPEGILIPLRGDAGETIKIKVRRLCLGEEDQQPKYVEVAGGSQRLFYQQAKADDLLPTPVSRPTVIVESELDGILLHAAAGELCSVVALGGAGKRPDHETYQLLIQSTLVIVALDADEAGVLNAKWWQKHFFHSILWKPPLGFKSIGDAMAAGVDARGWVINAIRQAVFQNRTREGHRGNDLLHFLRIAPAE